MGRAEGDRITVRLAWSPGPGRAEEASLAAGGLLAPGAAPPARVGIWGRRRAIDAALADGDRVEVWRPLQVEPMDARRARARSQRERATGLRAERSSRR